MMFMHVVARDARSEPLLTCHDVYVAACDALCKPLQSAHRHIPCPHDGDVESNERAQQWRQDTAEAREVTRFAVTSAEELVKVGRDATAPAK